MKEFNYIASKIFKRGFCFVLLIAICFFAVCLNVFNKQDVYAKEQIAIVNCCVNLVEDENKELITEDVKMFSNLDTSSMNFGDVNVKINARSRIEYVYSVNNISSSDCVFALNLEKEKLENFKVEYFVDEDNSSSTETALKVKSGKTAKFTVVVSIENVSKNAVLDGSLNISIKKV